MGLSGELVCGWEVQIAQWHRQQWLDYPSMDCDCNCSPTDGLRAFGQVSSVLYCNTEGWSPVLWGTHLCWASACSSMKWKPFHRPGKLLSQPYPHISFIRVFLSWCSRPAGHWHCQTREEKAGTSQLASDSGQGCLSWTDRTWDSLC